MPATVLTDAGSPRPDAVRSRLSELTRALRHAPTSSKGAKRSFEVVTCRRRRLAIVGPALQTQTRLADPRQAADNHVKGSAAVDGQARQSTRGDIARLTGRTT